MSTNSKVFRHLLFRVFRYWPWIVGFGILGLTIFIVATYVWYVRDLATPESLMNRNNTGLILFDRHGDSIFESEGVKQFNIVSIYVIPDLLKQATIAVEDKDFYNHPGFSLRSILRALYSNLLARSPSRYGASTITQQLVKNALLSPEKSVKRKLQEIILSLEIERRYSKDQILEMYLNSIYYGSGAYGVQEASELYFGKDVIKLSLAESAILAALPQAPSRLTPFGGDKDELFKRRSIVLSKMVAQGNIQESEKKQAESLINIFKAPPKEKASTQAPHFAVWVRDYLYKKYGEGNVNRLGFRVTTTLDLTLQRAASAALTRQLHNLTRQHATNGGVVSLDPYTGEILVMVGSKDWYDEQFGKFNVVFAQRQPGSSFKPIVYTRAFMDGKTPSDILHDKPTDFSGYKPKNYDGRFRGDVTMRRALANSLNIPAVELLQQIGVEEALRLARDIGITTLKDENQYGLSLVLGGAEVELFELTRAYGVLATGGQLVGSQMILNIEDKTGKTIYTYNPLTKTEKDFLDSGVFDFLNRDVELFTDQYIGGMRSQQVIDEVSAYMTTNILSDSRARSEAFGSTSSLQLSRPAGVKTGTTDDYRDAWTIGYTPDLVAGVWIGNNDNTPMGQVAGAIGAAPIWHEFMETAHRGKPRRNFQKPPEIVEVEICLGSLNRACAACKPEDRVREIFRRGDEPKTLCPEEMTPTPAPTSVEITLPEPTQESEPSPIILLEPTPMSTIPPPTPFIPTLIPTLTVPIITPETYFFKEKQQWVSSWQGQIENLKEISWKK